MLSERTNFRSLWDFGSLKMFHFRSSVLICSGGFCWVGKNAALIAGGTSTHVPHFRYFVTQFPLTAGTTKTVVLPVLRRAATPKLGQLIPGRHDHGQQAYSCEDGNFANHSWHTQRRRNIRRRNVELVNRKWIPKEEAVNK